MEPLQPGLRPRAGALRCLGLVESGGGRTEHGRGDHVGYRSALGAPPRVHCGPPRVGLIPEA
eukprot:15461226-Alexandrium_andersonii.AAC.1